MKKYLILIVLLLITGCTQNKVEKISMECNGIKTEFEIQKGNEVTCTLLNEEYVFKVKDVNDDKIYIKTDKSGLTDSGSLLEKKQEFILSKDKELRLNTQTTDYQEIVVFRWN